MYCSNCKYDLRELGDARKCPECGTPFHPDRPQTYRRTPDARPSPSRRRRERDTLWMLPVFIGFVIGQLTSFGVGETFAFLREETMYSRVIGYTEPTLAHTLTVCGILALAAAIVLTIRLRSREAPHFLMGLFAGLVVGFLYFIQDLL